MYCPITLTDFAVYAGSTRRTLADVSSLRQDVAGGTVLTGFSDTRVQRFFAVPAGELRRAYASVIRRFVLLHRVIFMIVIILILELIIIVALVVGAAFLRAFLHFPLVDRRAVGTPASDNVHSTFAIAASVVSVFTPLLQSSAVPAVAEILLENRLTRRAVLTR